MITQQSLDMLDFEFFREFARCEYCLKIVGLRDPKHKDPTADWGDFASKVCHVFESPPNADVSSAIRYYLDRDASGQYQAVDRTSPFTAAGLRAARRL